MPCVRVYVVGAGTDIPSIYNRAICLRRQNVLRGFLYRGILFRGAFVLGGFLTGGLWSGGFCQGLFIGTFDL